MKQKNICKDLNFSDCELAILRMAVDKAEEKMGRRIVNSEDVQKIIDIVEEFKSSLKVIVNSISGKLCKIMTIDKYLNVMIPESKNLIDMNIFDDNSYFERKVTEMVNRLKTK